MKKKKIIIYLFVLAAIAGLAAIWILAGKDEIRDDRRETTKEGMMEVYFLDVGQGDSILVRSEGESMLIDAGTNEDEELVISYLKKLGVEHLDYVIATHPHIDHIGGMDAVMENFSVGICFMPQETYDSASYNDVMEIVQEKEILISYPDFQESYQIGSGQFVFITPDSDKQYEDVNDSSIGIRLTNGKHSFLLCGDISTSIEKQILNSGILIRSDVMKLNHHGSSDSNSWDFIKKVSPSYVVVTCGRRNEFGHPHEKVMKRIKEYGAGIFRTDRQGTVVFFSDGKNLGSIPGPEMERQGK